MDNSKLLLELQSNDVQIEALLLTDFKIIQKPISKKTNGFSFPY